MTGWAVSGLAVAILGIAATSPPIVFVGGAIVVIGALAEVWPRRVLEGLEYQRTVHPGRTVVGDRVELRISLWNRTRLPVVWAGAQDTLPTALRVDPQSLRPDERGSAQPLRVAGALRPYERMRRRFELVPLVRGVHEIGPARAAVAELFGTHHPRRDFEIEPTLVVARPQTVPLVGSLPAEAPLAQRRRRRSLYTDPTLFAGVRPFQPGDPVRAIHWRASARDGALQSKRFEPSMSRQAVVVLDVQTVEGEYWMLLYDDVLFEELCVAAVSAARDLIAHDTACGLAAAAYSGSLQRYVFVPARADRAQVGRLGDALARLTTESSMPLGQLLSLLPRHVARGTTLLVLTGRDPSPQRGIVRRLARTGFPVTFVLLRATREQIAYARRAGLAVADARLEGPTGAPSAVVVEA